MKKTFLFFVYYIFYATRMTNVLFYEHKMLTIIRRLGVFRGKHNNWWGLTDATVQISLPLPKLQVAENSLIRCQTAVETAVLCLWLFGPCSVGGHFHLHWSKAGSESV